MTVVPMAPKKWVLLSILCLLLSAVQPVQGGVKHFTLGEVNVVSEPVTLETNWQFGDSLDTVEQVVLAGFYQEANTKNPALVLQWVQDTESWWPTWQLQLKSVAGQLRSSQLSASTSNTEPGVTQYDLGQTRPTPGHRYQALFSYDAPTGALSVLLTDTTTATRVYSGSFSYVYQGTLQPGAMLATKQPTEQQAPTLIKWSLTPGYIPYASNWQIGLIEGPQIFTPMKQFDRANPVLVRLEIPNPAPRGIYRVVSVSAGKTAILTTVASTPGSVTIKLDTQLLPVGKSQLALEYVEDNKVKLRDTQDIVVGSATFRFNQVGVKREQGVLATTLRLQSDDVLRQLPVQVLATVKEVVWDSTKRQYGERLHAENVPLFAQKLDFPANRVEDILPISLRLPDKPGMWKVNFQVKVDADIKVQVGGSEQWFYTYTPAVTQPGSSYSLVILPDTQYMTKNYPQILTRQFQWIAENSATRKIGFVLQVGDITNDNNPTQWQEAYKSYSILNGITPYAVALGNHDLAPGHGAVEHREQSLIQEYFTANDFAGFGGTQKAGRLDNTYHLFKVAGIDYLVVSLEFAPPNEALEWANQVIAKYPNHKTIIITHSYVSKSGYRTLPGTNSKAYAMGQDKTTTMNDGEEMWNKLVRKHANVMMVVSGHYGVSSIPYNVGKGDHGNRVLELLVDYQEEPNGGNGWLVMLDFNTDGTIMVQAYSPYLDEYKKDWERGFNNRFLYDPVKGLVSMR